MCPIIHHSVTDPGFPVGGGAGPLGGGTDLQHVHFSAKTYAKTKEIDPVGGARAGGAPWIRQCHCIYHISFAGYMFRSFLPSYHKET